MRTKLYWVWSAMIQRCHNPKARAYPWYGARGIAVCKRWRLFANFQADMGQRPSDCYQLDRIDSNGDYESSNCRWATAKVQKQNTRRCLRWHIVGRTFDSSWDAAAAFGVDQKTIRRWCGTVKGLRGRSTCFVERLYQ